MKNNGFTSRIVSWIALLVVGVLGLAMPSDAQIVLKPNGQDAAPLRVKSLDANVRLQGQFAQTTLTYIFQNETTERIEADFMYSVPQHATVTYFAYWYGNEKVVARVVEKERAAQIYRYITTRMRDPALIEMVGKNTFRARIFPVMPNADLKVEIHTVQVLPSDSRGAFYTLPLRGPKEGKGTFENLSINIEGVLDGAFSAVGNNLGQPIKTEGSKFHFQLQQKNYLAPRDLEILLKPRAANLRAVVYARRAGGGDGFFALALSPNTVIKNPKIAFSGIKIYDIAPSKLPNVAANGTLLVTGRYSGSGFATTVLSDGKRQWKTLVQLTSQSEGNNLAAKSWAARRIEDLSGNAKNKNAVMALSQRFTLPSKWTSWLAIPKEEIERYKQEKAVADMDYYGRLLAVEIAQGRGNGKSARQFKTRFQEAARLTSDVPSLKDWAQERLDEMADIYASADSKGKELARAEMRGLARLAGVKVGDYLNLARLEAVRQREQEKRQAREAQIDAQLNSVAVQIVRELMQKGDTPRARNLHVRLKSLSDAKDRYAPAFMNEQIKSQAGDLARELIKQKIKTTPDAERVARIEKRLAILNRYSEDQKYVDNLLYEIERQTFGDDIYKEAREMVELRHRENPDKKRLNVLEEKFKRYGGKFRYVDDQLWWAKSNWANPIFHQTTTLMAEERYKPSPNPELLKKLQNQLDEALNELGAPQDDAERKRRLSAFWERADINVINRAVQNMESFLGSQKAQRQPAIREGRHILARANEEIWKRGHNTPMESSVESASLRGLLDKAETQEGNLSQEVQGSLFGELELQMRWGDPLISIEAPADARQVIALLPTGEIKRLIRNGTKWQARFDIPTHAAEGDFPITVVIVSQDGTRRQIALHFAVDVTAPRGQGAIKFADEKLRLDLVGDSDTTRVSALLPWNQKVELSASTQIATRFFAIADVPAAWRNKAMQITYILTDRAHNRTTITVDMEK